MSRRKEIQTRRGGPARRAPLPRGIPQRSAAGPAPSFAVIPGSEIYALAEPVLLTLAEEYGSVDAAVEAVADAERPIAEVANAITRQGHGKAARLALGLLWHLFLQKQPAAEQSAIQAAAALLAEKRLAGLLAAQDARAAASKH